MLNFGLFYPKTCNYLLIIVFFTYKMFFYFEFFLFCFLYVWFTRALNVAKNYSLIFFLTEEILINPTAVLLCDLIIICND